MGQSRGGGREHRSEDLFTVMVDGIPARCNKHDVTDVFVKFGELGDVFLPPDRKFGRHPDDHRGYAFVRYFKKADQEDCVEECKRNPPMLKDSELKVRFATTRPRDKPGYEQRRDERRDRDRFDDRRGGRDYRGGGFDRGFGGGGGGYRDRGFDDRERRDYGGGRDRYYDRDRYDRRSPPPRGGGYDRGGYDRRDDRGGYDRRY